MVHRSGAVAAFVRRRLALLLAGPLFALAATDVSADGTSLEVQQDGRSLEDIAARNRHSDPWSLRVVTIRCTSFYISASAVERESRPALAAQYEENAALFLARAVVQSRDEKEILIGHLTRLSRMYYVMSQAAREASDDPYEHPLLRADLRFCTRLASQV